MALDYETDSVKFEHADGVAVITLNRPHEGNAITPDLQRGVVAAWEEIEREASIRVAIVTGAGERHFCTGASVAELRDDEDSMLQGGSLQDAVRLSSHQVGVTKPVICAVNGLVNAGGLHLVVDADIVIASQTAAFMDTHTSVGQVSGLESIGLARRMTVGSALLLALAGRHYRMPADRAHQLGLVDLLEPTPMDAMATARTLAASIALNSPEAMRASKAAVWASLEMGYLAAMENGWEHVKSQWSHPDFREGPKAFSERRSPLWT
ncbi:Carnitinyl-CoA dehydratase [compost metagenome]